MKKYLIRESDSTAERGPFDLDELVTLVEADQISQDTLYFDEEDQAWASINSNKKIKAALFPEEHKLALKAKVSKNQAVPVRTPKKEEEMYSPIEIKDLLAEAMPSHSYVKYSKTEQTIASMCLSGLGTIMLLSSLGILIPYFSIIINVIKAGSFLELLRHPLIFIGVVDIVLAAALFLGHSQIYPALRFRAMFGLSFFGYCYWSTQEPFQAFCAVIGSIGILVSTLTLNGVYAFIALLLGVAAIGINTVFAVF